MREYPGAVVSLRSHYRSAYLAETYAMAPSTPVEYAFIAFPFDFEGGTFKTARTQGLAYDKFLAYHPTALVVLDLQFVYPS